MTVKIVDIPDIGTVELRKNRRAKSVKLALQPDGSVRVTQPAWAPFAVGIEFANSRKDWVHQHRPQATKLSHGMPVGKSHHLYFLPDRQTNKVSARKHSSRLVVTHPTQLPSSHPEVQTAARKLGLQALRKEAGLLLEQRLKLLADRHDFVYSSLRVRVLKARWGSCDQHKRIVLNIYLMKLPWDLIDYVLIHELVHTEHLNHGVQFWQRFEAAMPDAKHRRKSIRAYRPSI